MDASTQEAVQRLVERFQPQASEYCLLWIDWWGTCLAKSEWAAWVQAIGALVAIGSAYWIGKSQQRAAEAIEAARKRDADLRTLQSIMLMAQNAVSMCQLFTRKWDQEPIVPPTEILKGMDGFRAFASRVDPLAIPTAGLAAELIRLPRSFSILDLVARDVDTTRLTSAERFNAAHDALRRQIRALEDQLASLVTECSDEIRLLG